MMEYTTEVADQLSHHTYGNPMSTCRFTENKRFFSGLDVCGIPAYFFFLLCFYLLRFQLEH